jgi:hypothetical protein
MLLVKPVLLVMERQLWTALLRAEQLFTGLAPIMFIQLILVGNQLIAI